MNARKQAREAGDVAWLYDNISEACCAAADAASDIWEPLVCDAVEIIEGLEGQQAMSDDGHKSTLRKLRRALGRE